MTDIWETVHQERAALVSDLKDLQSEQWTTASLCPDWEVHDVLAHLVADAKTTKLSFVTEMIRARFNFDRVNELGIAKEKKASPVQTLAAFEGVQNRTTSAPAPKATRLVEAIVHGEDIRRPLNIEHRYPTDAVIEALEYQLNTGASMGGSKEKVQGLRLIATDANFSHGEGIEVTGSALALLLAVAGRTVRPHEISGDGVKNLITTDK